MCCSDDVLQLCDMHRKDLWILDPRNCHGQSRISVFSVLNLRESAWFLYSYIMHYAINDILLLFINFLIDLKLFIVLRGHLVVKRRNIQLCNLTQAKKLAEIRKAESNSNKLVIYSFIVYLICRLPELVFYTHLLFVHDNSIDYFDYYTFCESSICYLFVNCIHFLYMLSYLSNILIYYELNKTFRHALKKYFGITRHQ